MNLIAAPSVTRRHRIRDRETGRYMLLTPGKWTKAGEQQPYIFVRERFLGTKLTADEARRYLGRWFHETTHEVTTR